MKFLATSVIRGSTWGDSHGGIYLVDFDKLTAHKKVDWDDKGINFAGYGGERGLRGITVWKNRIFAVSSRSIIEFKFNFKIVKEYTCKSLLNCHDICIEKRDHLLIASTSMASIVVFDLANRKFAITYKINFSNGTIDRVDPINNNLEPDGRGHINNVFCLDDHMYFSGTTYPYIYIQTGETNFEPIVKINDETHNARILENGLVVYNDTGRNRITADSQYSGIKSFFYPPIYNDVINFEIGEKIARQGFTRGLYLNDGFMVGGSSPANLSLYEYTKYELPIKNIRISNDIRNAVHGVCRFEG